MRIWFALLLAPVLALADQGIAYATAGWACANQQSIAVHGVHFVFLAAVIVATIMAWQLWRMAPAAGAGEEPVARRHFLAGIATASGALSALVIAAMWIPSWMISPCSG